MTPSSAEPYDAIVIGAGQAGPPLAMRLAAAGQRVALIERGAVGGTCVNTGCTPTKALVASARAAYIARRAADFGIAVAGPVSADMKRIKARKDAIVATKQVGLRSGIEHSERLTLIEGHARLVSAKAVTVNGGTLTADRLFIDVGARAVVPPLAGLEAVDYLTNVSILELDVLPSHLIVLGGSYIALEFAQMYRRFGSAVTVIERAERLIAREDADVSAAVLAILQAEGVEVRLGVETAGVQRQGNGLAVTLDAANGGAAIEGSHLLVAVGRRPNTDDLGLDAAGVACDAHGFIEVDDQLRTSVPGIWAMGDCNGRGAFTHTAYNDYEIVAANLLDGEARRVSDRVPCHAMYIDPPLARAGMTMAEARHSGRRVLVGERPMDQVARAIEKGETAGFMRILVDGDSTEILGTTILGTGGDEVIHSVIDLMAAKAPYTVMQRAMHIHPTVSELLPTILGSLKPA